MFPIFAGNSASTGYNLTRSLRFRSSASAYLSRTPASAGNRKTWTWSAWVKRGTLATADYPTLFSAATDADNFSSLNFYDVVTGYLQFNYVVGGNDTTRIATTQVFRDPSAWYHIVLAVDTTQATAANRMKLYVNGSQITAFSYASYPSQNTDMWVNSANPHGIGITRGVGGRYYDGYLTEINFIDGQALTPSSFGSYSSTTGVWQPAAYTGTYGTNGFYLPFTDNSALTTSSNVGLGKDFSGNGNYWTTNNNISITAGVTYDSMTDVPTLTSATASNFAVLNPLDNGGLTVGSANLNSSDSAGSYKSIRSTIGVSSGKWYWEVTATSGTNLVCGVSKASAAQSTGNYVGVDANGWGYAGNNGQKYTSGSGSAYGSSYTSGDVIGVAFDADAGTLTFYKNNSSQGTAFTGLTSGPYFSAVSNYSSGWAANFGQRPFSYTPPTGFVALCTYNLPTSTIVKGNTVMDATLYTGTLLSNAVTNAAAFKPDLVWLKSRSAATDNKLTDSVRGVTKSLSSNSTAAEATDVQGLTAFNTNGFTVGTNTDYNNLAATYVAWQWQAGQGTTSSNTSGSITSTVSVNASAGFSVATMTGNGSAFTFGHGLGVAPAMVIVKYRSGSAPNINGWAVYHQSLSSAAYRIDLNSTSGQISDTNAWNSTAPTSTVATVGTNLSVNGTPLVAYCWTPIAGYSAFGSLTGNGSADGPMVYTGFLPRFILYKRTDSTSDWRIWDTARNTYNAMSSILYPNTSDAEYTATTQDFDALSNGFKVRNSSAAMNASGGSYIYAAFATSPFKYALAR